MNYSVMEMKQKHLIMANKTSDAQVQTTAAKNSEIRK